MASTMDRAYPMIPKKKGLFEQKWFFRSKDPTEKIKGRLAGPLLCHLEWLLNRKMKARTSMARLSLVRMPFMEPVSKKKTKRRIPMKAPVPTRENQAKFLKKWWELVASFSSKLTFILLEFRWAFDLLLNSARYTNKDLEPQKQKEFGFLD